MKQENPKLVIGFIAYGRLTGKYLPYFLPSLESQTFTDFKVVILDNSENRENQNKKYLHDHHSNLDIEYHFVGENIGFAGAYNKIIKKAFALGAKYLLVVNPDVILDAKTIQRMVDTLDKDGKLGSVSPKILKWDFPDNAKTTSIDSFGIKLMPGLRFVDIGQGEIDQGQFDEVEILGPSGACGMFRMKALKKIKECENYYDESMFMYKEDCDLAYRLKLAGYKSRLVRRAIAYHDRTVQGKGEGIFGLISARMGKSNQSVKWSFLHQQIIYCKYWRLLDAKNKLILIWHQIRLLGYMILFERYLFLELPKLHRLCKKTKTYMQ